MQVDTANGRTRAAPVTLDRLAVGGIVERAVPALIAQPGQLKTSLLGMSFLNRLESWEVRGDRLVHARHIRDGVRTGSTTKPHRHQQQETCRSAISSCALATAQCASRAP